MCKDIKCKVCKKTPDELTEYKLLAEEQGYPSPTIAVIEDEGTYNPKTGKFYCTACYIKAGMPLGKA